MTSEHEPNIGADISSNHPIRYFSTKDSTESVSSAYEKTTSQVETCEQDPHHKNFYATVNNNVKRIENQLLPKLDSRQRQSGDSGRLSEAKQLSSSSLRCRLNTSRRRLNVMNAGQDHEGKHKIRGKISNKRSNYHAQLYHRRNLGPIDENVIDGWNRQNDFSNCSATVDSSYIRTKPGISCLMQDADGRYRRRRVVLVPRRRPLANSGSERTNKDNSSCISAQATALSSSSYDWSFATVPSRYRISRSRSLPSSSSSHQDVKYHSKRYRFSTSPNLSKKLNTTSSNLAIPDFSTMPSIYETMERQAEPSVSLFPNIRPTRLDSSNGNSLLSRCIFHFRRIFFPKSANDTHTSRTNMLSRFLSIFRSSPEDHQSLKDFSTTSTSTRTNLFCWTCFEMDGENETLSSVDSESGSDDNEDPDDGDGDVGCDNDDFNDQEDIEAIEYSSDGGGDCSDNSSVNNENDSFWQDDLINQESNNCGLNEFDDCEDDEIEIARKAGYGFLEERCDEDVDTQSIIGRRDWYYEMFRPERNDNDYEAEILGITESRATEDIDAYNFFV